MTYMLDTNVLMHFVNDERRYAKILKHIDRIGKARICISSITVHEVHTKLIKAKVSKDKIEALAAVLAQFTVHNFTSKAAIESAKVRAALEIKGVKIGALDVLLAGHAKSDKAVLVTNNTGEFNRVHGLKVEDWIT
jgi:tRNA(fMet)-specific endonuclease VapC